MRGHEAIITMRRQRAAPAAVWVGEAGVDVHWHKYSDATCEVEILPIEHINQLDLRWAVGLGIRLDIQGVDRGDALFEAFKKASAKRIICNIYELAPNANGFIVPSLIEIKDTEGVMVWRQ